MLLITTLTVTQITMSNESIERTDIMASESRSGAAVLRWGPKDCTRCKGCKKCSEFKRYLRRYRDNDEDEVVSSENAAVRGPNVSFERFEQEFVIVDDPLGSDS